MVSSELETLKIKVEELERERDQWKEEYFNVCKFATDYEEQRDQALTLLRKAREALEKIADPRKRGHSEPDEYTQHGCAIHIAETTLIEIDEALKEIKSGK